MTPPHSDDCLMVRYCNLPSDDREWWQPDFSGRLDLCTCDADPDAPAKRPEFAEAVTELREYLEGR
jgi:hypothetical protein